MSIDSPRQLPDKNFAYVPTVEIRNAQPTNRPLNPSDARCKDGLSVQTASANKAQGTTPTTTAPLSSELKSATRGPA